MNLKYREMERGKLSATLGLGVFLALGLAEFQRRKKKQWKARYYELRKELILQRVKEGEP